VFDASAKCPAYVVPDELAQAVREKQAADDAEFAKLVAKGTPVAQLNTGIDGGMNRVFAARVPNGNTGLSESTSGIALFNTEKAPGTIPNTVNPPHGPVSSPEEPLAASLAPASSSTRVAAVAPPASSGESDGFFSSLARKVGLGSASADTTATTPQPTAPARPRTAEARPPRPEGSIPKPKAETKQASAKPASKRATADTAADTQAPAPAAPSMVAGAQPIVSTNSFDSRFSATK
jgi:hypothetical protein